MCVCVCVCVCLCVCWCARACARSSVVRVYGRRGRSKRQLRGRDRPQRLLLFVPRHNLRRLLLIACLLLLNVLPLHTSSPLCPSRPSNALTVPCPYPSSSSLFVLSTAPCPLSGACPSSLELRCTGEAHGPDSLCDSGHVSPVLGPRSQCSGASSPDCDCDQERGAFMCMYVCVWKWGAIHWKSCNSNKNIE